nr:hypothetical protein [Candidatus Rhabdochlamydia porcellionis]
MWLEQILIPEIKSRQVIILDNASFHKSKESLEIIKKIRMRSIIFTSLFS